VPGTHDQLSLSWSQSSDQDFLRYELYRSLDGVVDSTDILTFVSANETAFIDTGLLSDRTYYFRVLVRDRAGNSSWSNTVSGHTGIDEPPTAATLLPVFPETDHYQSIDIHWTQPMVSDFQSYRLYSWRGNNGRSDSALVALIVRQDSIAFTDHTYFDDGADTVNYWYVVHTTDQGGNAAASNTIQVRLIDGAPGLPDGVVLPDSARINITWSNLDIPDFGSYRLLRDTTSNVSSAVMIFASFDQALTSYTDRAIVSGLYYYYWLEIVDRRGHLSRSFLGSARW